VAERAAAITEDKSRDMADAARSVGDGVDERHRARLVADRDSRLHALTGQSGAQVASGPTFSPSQRTASLSSGGKGTTMRSYSIRSATKAFFAV
jgi:hypothetical protein